MDNLVEQVVKRKKNGKYYMNVFLIIFATIAIPGLLFALGFIYQAYFVYISIFVFLFCVYGAWFFITSLKIEYEYSSLGGTFRVDKIVAKRNRKKVLKFDLKIVDEIFHYTDEEMAKRKFNKVFSVGAQEYSEDNCVIVFQSEAKGKCAVVFTPNEKMLNGIRPYLKHDVIRAFYK